MSTRALQIDIMLLGFRDPDTDSVLAGGTVNFFNAGTSDPATVWDEKEKTNARTSVTLDSNGQAQVYGDGIYKLEILDVNSVAVAYSPLDNIKIRAVSTNVVETNTTYTATTDDDLILGDTSGGPLTINLYPAADFISELSIKNISAAGNAITVDPDGSELIDGAATEDLSDNQAQAYYSNSSNWFGAGVSTGINFTSTSLIFGDGFQEDTTAGVTTVDVVDVYSTDGTLVLDGGTDGLDATFEGVSSLASLAETVTPPSGAQVLAGVENTLGMTAASFVAAGQTVGAEGSVALPGGMVMKWGKTASTASGTQIVTFASAFPNNNFSSLITPEASVGIAAPTIHTVSVSGFTIIKTTLDFSHYWFAIGN